MLGISKILAVENLNVNNYKALIDITLMNQTVSELANYGIDYIGWKQLRNYREGSPPSSPAIAEYLYGNGFKSDDVGTSIPKMEYRPGFYTGPVYNNKIMLPCLTYRNRRLVDMHGSGTNTNVEEYDRFKGIPTALKDILWDMYQESEKFYLHCSKENLKPMPPHHSYVLEYLLGDLLTGVYSLIAKLSKPDTSGVSLALGTLQLRHGLKKKHEKFAANNGYKGKEPAEYAQIQNYHQAYVISKKSNFNVPIKDDNSDYLDVQSLVAFTADHFFKWFAVYYSDDRITLLPEAVSAHSKSEGSLSQSLTTDKTNMEGIDIMYLFSLCRTLDKDFFYKQNLGDSFRYSVLEWFLSLKKQKLLLHLDGSKQPVFQPMMSTYAGALLTGADSIEEDSAADYRKTRDAHIRFLTDFYQHIYSIPDKSDAIQQLCYQASSISNNSNTPGVFKFRACVDNNPKDPNGDYYTLNRGATKDPRYAQYYDSQTSVHKLTKNGFEKFELLSKTMQELESVNSILERRGYSIADILDAYYSKKIYTLQGAIKFGTVTNPRKLKTLYEDYKNNNTAPISAMNSNLAVDPENKSIVITWEPPTQIRATLKQQSRDTYLNLKYMSTANVTDYFTSLEAAYMFLLELCFPKTFSTNNTRTISYLNYNNKQSLNDDCSLNATPHTLKVAFGLLCMIYRDGMFIEGQWNEEYTAQENYPIQRYCFNKKDAYSNAVLPQDCTYNEVSSFLNKTRVALEIFYTREDLPVDMVFETILRHTQGIPDNILQHPAIFDTIIRKKKDKQGNIIPITNPDKLTCLQDWFERGEFSSLSGNSFSPLKWKQLLCSTPPERENSLIWLASQGFRNPTVQKIICDYVDTTLSTAHLVIAQYPYLSYGGNLYKANIPCSDFNNSNRKSENAFSPVSIEEMTINLNRDTGNSPYYTRCCKEWGRVFDTDVGDKIADKIGTVTLDASTIWAGMKSIFGVDTETLKTIPSFFDATPDKMPTRKLQEWYAPLSTELPDTDIRVKLQVMLNLRSLFEVPSDDYVLRRNYSTYRTIAKLNCSRAFCESLNNIYKIAGFQAQQQAYREEVACSTYSEGIKSQVLSDLSTHENTFFFSNIKNKYIGIDVTLKNLTAGFAIGSPDIAQVVHDQFTSKTSPHRKLHTIFRPYVMLIPNLGDVADDNTAKQISNLMVRSQLKYIPQYFIRISQEIISLRNYIHNLINDYKSKFPVSRGKRVTTTTQSTLDSIFRSIQGESDILKLLESPVILDCAFYSKAAQSDWWGKTTPDPKANGFLRWTKDKSIVGKYSKNPLNSIVTVKFYHSSGGVIHYIYSEDSAVSDKPTYQFLRYTDNDEPDM